MSDRGVVVLGAIVLAAATQVFSLWTVQMLAVPFVVFFVLFALLVRGPVTAEAGETAVAARDPRASHERAAEQKGRAA